MSSSHAHSAKPAVAAAGSRVGHSVSSNHRQPTTPATGAEAPRCDVATITAFLRHLWTPGATYELRTLGATARAAYFEATEQGIAAAASAIEACDGLAAPSGIYTTLNPVAPALRDAKRHRDQFAPCATTARDADVVARHALLVDCDPARAKGVNATDADVDAALARSAEIRAGLDLAGWPPPLVVGMSGNGAHLLYRLDLPADDDGQVQRALRGIASRYSDDAVDVDVKVANASRITKVMGTVARRGPAEADRPQRVARVLELPPDAGEVTAAHLAAVAAWAATAPKPPPRPRSPTPAADDFYAVLEALDQRHVLACLSGGPLVKGERLEFKGQRGGRWAILVDGALTSNWIDEHGRIGAAAKGARNGGPLASTWCRYYGHSDVEIRRGLIAAVPELARFATAPPPAPAPADDRVPAGGRAQVVCMADVVREHIEWLWADRIPRGMLTVIDGDPGLGKSCITMDLAARVSNGAAMPFDPTPRPAAGVVLLTAEDHLAATIRPRLDAAGANASRIVAITGVDRPGDDGAPVSLPADMGHLEAAIRDQGAALVVIDPIMAYLGAGIDAYRDQDVRRALAPLAKIAEATGAAIVIVRHLRKGAGPAMYRGGGSIGIVGAARSALLAARDPNDRELRYLAPTKGNLGPPCATLKWTVVDADGVPKIEWLGIADGVTADQIAAVPDGHDAGERNMVAEAEDVIRAMLADGTVRADTGERQVMSAVGCSKATVRRARESLGVFSQQSRSADGRVAGWVWAMKSGPGAHVPEREHLGPRPDAEQLQSRDVARPAPDVIAPESTHAERTGEHLEDDASATDRRTPPGPSSPATDAHGQLSLGDLGHVPRGGLHDEW